MHHGLVVDERGPVQRLDQAVLALKLLQDVLTTVRELRSAAIPEFQNLHPITGWLPLVILQVANPEEGNRLARCLLPQHLGRPFSCRVCPWWPQRPSPGRPRSCWLGRGRTLCFGSARLWPVRPTRSTCRDQPRQLCGPCQLAVGHGRRHVQRRDWQRRQLHHPGLVVPRAVEPAACAGERNDLLVVYRVDPHKLLKGQAALAEAYGDKIASSQHADHLRLQ
mmetsp:Transcript_6708/g.21456  ORF Transcript_6708/g.21456 Transcript_6708/m.21456 type:complete len:222 (+) Transcript_6708:1729-2394(+)